MHRRQVHGSLLKFPNYLRFWLSLLLEILLFRQQNYPRIYFSFRSRSLTRFPPLDQDKAKSCASGDERALHAAMSRLQSPKYHLAYQFSMLSRAICRFRSLVFFNIFRSRKHYCNLLIAYLTYLNIHTNVITARTAKLGE